jgi:DNA-binding NtrC family response regulator
MKCTPKRILVVDDKPAVLMTYQLILKQQGYDVVGASSCESALAELSRRSFDLILCDYTLEDDRNGFHVIDEARKMSPGVRSLLMTGYSEEEVGDEARLRGVTVLCKPLNVHDLLKAVAAESSLRATA